MPHGVAGPPRVLVDTLSVGAEQDSPAFQGKHAVKPPHLFSVSIYI